LLEPIEYEFSTSLLKVNDERWFIIGTGDALLSTKSRERVVESFLVIVLAGSGRLDVEPSARGFSRDAIGATRAHEHGVLVRPIPVHDGSPLMNEELTVLRQRFIAACVWLDAGLRAWYGWPDRDGKPTICAPSPLALAALLSVRTGAPPLDSSCSVPSAS
jgi:hypothetical protein